MDTGLVTYRKVTWIIFLERGMAMDARWMEYSISEIMGIFNTFESFSRPDKHFSVSLSGKETDCFASVNIPIPETAPHLIIQRR